MCRKDFEFTLVPYKRTNYDTLIVVKGNYDSECFSTEKKLAAATAISGLYYTITSLKVVNSVSPPVEIFHLQDLLGVTEISDAMHNAIIFHMKGLEEKHLDPHAYGH